MFGKAKSCSVAQLRCKKILHFLIVVDVVVVVVVVVLFPGSLRQGFSV
jgi:t-SNARE complex subunit (syntaxin)